MKKETMRDYDAVRWESKSLKNKFLEGMDTEAGWFHLGARYAMLWVLEMESLPPSKVDALDISIKDLP